MVQILQLDCFLIYIYIYIYIFSYPCCFISINFLIGVPQNFESQLKSSVTACYLSFELLLIGLYVNITLLCMVSGDYNVTICTSNGSIQLTLS